MDNIVSFKGKVLKPLFVTDDWKIYIMDVDWIMYPDIKRNKYNSVTIVGSNIFELDPQVEYTITGIEKNNAKFGWQYEVSMIKGNAPINFGDSFKFLSSILTPNQCSVLLDVYPNIIDLIINDKISDIDLTKTKGIKEITFQKIVDKVRQNFVLFDICNDFYGILELNEMYKLYNKYKSPQKIKEVLKSNPYKALTNINRIGFKKADQLLLKIEQKIKNDLRNNIEPPFVFNGDLISSADRCDACMQYYIEEARDNDGHTAVSSVELKTKVKAYAPQAIEHFEELARNEEKYWYDSVNKLIALQSVYKIEVCIAQKLIEQLQINNSWNIYEKDKYVNVADDITISDQQESLQEYVDKNNVVLLSGPAGSGKTMSVIALLQMLDDNDKTYAMAAPSAKAAKVLKDYTNYDATTIHRLLKYRPSEQGLFYYNENNKLPYDLIIIDESSMMDIYLFLDLLKAINFKRTKLLLIGDPYQIKSVGAGSVFRDLIKSQKFAYLELNKIFRYGNNGILTVATDCRNNKIFLPLQKDKLYHFNINKSYFFVPKSDEDILEYVSDLYAALLKYNKIDDCIVISPMNKGPCGTIALNNCIQEKINPSTESISIQIDKQEILFKLNDMVINTANNYHSTVCDEYGFIMEQVDGSPMETLIANGESGRIVKVLKNSVVIKYDDNYILAGREDLINLRLGYAISAHKSQGSGYPNVILVSAKSHQFFLDNSLIYTGITRAKKTIYHIGSPEIVNRGVKKVSVDKRKTNLSKILKYPPENIDNILKNTNSTMKNNMVKHINQNNNIKVPQDVDEDLKKENYKNNSGWLDDLAFS